MILKQNGTRMAEDGEDWNELEMTILKSLVFLFSKYTNDDIAPLITLQFSTIKDSFKPDLPSTRFLVSTETKTDGSKSVQSERVTL